MASIIINGLTITGGRNINISNGRVIIDGKDVTPDIKEISIQITGDVETLSVDACNKIEVNGNVAELSTQSGDVRCQSVGGDVSTMSGDVHCTTVAGRVKTMSGDINHR